MCKTLSTFSLWLSLRYRNWHSVDSSIFPRCQMSHCLHLLFALSPNLYPSANMQTDNVQAVSTLGTAGRTCRHSDRKEDSLKRLLSSSLWLADNWNSRIAQDSHAARRERVKLWCQPEGILSLGKRLTSCQASLQETGAKAVPMGRTQLGQAASWRRLLTFQLNPFQAGVPLDPCSFSVEPWITSPFLLFTIVFDWTAEQTGSWPQPAWGLSGGTLWQVLLKSNSRVPLYGTYIYVTLRSFCKG